MHRIAFPACFLSLLFCLSLIPTGSYSQENAITIGNKLTANQREWVLKDTKRTLGQHKCINGEVYRFGENNKLIHKYCSAGTWHNRTLPWSVKKVGNDWQITINRDQYILVLGKEGKKDRLVLRTLGSGKKAVTTDRIYISE
jgi:hypothetical protein